MDARVASNRSREPRVVPCIEVEVQLHMPKTRARETVHGSHARRACLWELRTEVTQTGYPRGHEQKTGSHERVVHPAMGAAIVVSLRVCIVRPYGT